jgi:cation transport protein ChaC
MINNSYNPKWVSVHTNCGVKKALSFVIRRDSPSYAYRMSDENIAEVISRAAGFLGPCCDYLFETAKALKEAGIQDKTLERLVRMVKGFREKC